MIINIQPALPSPLTSVSVEIGMTLNEIVFDQFTAPARAKPQLWRLVLGCAICLFVYLGFMAILGFAMIPIVGRDAYFGWMAGLMAPATPGHVLFVLFSFAGMILGVSVAVSACHQRAPGTLLGPAHRFVPDFLQTFVYLIPPYVVLGAWAFKNTGVTPNLALQHWLGLLPLAVPLVLLQVTAEELIFRGYLPQQLAARFKARWVWLLIPAVVFTLLHFDPRAGISAFAVLGVILTFALASTDLTMRRGNLGPSIAWHFLNNCFALLFIAVDGTISGLALYVTPYTIADASELARSSVIDFAMIILIWSLLKRFLRG